MRTIGGQSDGWLYSRLTRRTYATWMETHHVRDEKPQLRLQDLRRDLFKYRP